MGSQHWSHSLAYVWQHCCANNSAQVDLMCSYCWTIVTHHVLLCCQYFQNIHIY